MSKVKVDLIEVVGRRRRRSVGERLQICGGVLCGRDVGCAGSPEVRDNASQVLQWRRLQQDGLLIPPSESSVKLLPVSVIEEREPAKIEAVLALLP